MVHSTNINSIPITETLFINKTIKKRFPFLYKITLFHAIAFVISLLLTFIDDRTLSGTNVWIKPVKFYCSSFIFLWTISWYIIVYPFKQKTKLQLANTFSILFLIETTIIAIQAGRGTLSHYNISSPLNAILFASMGISIAAITLLILFIFLKSFSKKLSLSTPMKWGVRIAWFAVLFSCFVGQAMIQSKGHNVGVADGGEGLPFLNWSTKGGDLRVAHFLGLHAIQIIPIMIILIGKTRIKTQIKQRLGIGFAVFYLAWIVFTFIQAQLGTPFLAL